MKLRKKSKILAAAIAMLALSTAASVTGTVAWFTASNSVSATGMYVRADAESGIVITNEDATKVWKTTSIATYPGANDAPALVPTHTADCTTWTHGLSDDASVSDKGEEAYQSFTAGDTASDTKFVVSSGVAQAVVNGGNANIFLVNKFFIRSTTAETLTKKLSIEKVEAGIKDNATSVSGDLNKSLRIAIVQNTSKLFYAPNRDQTTGFYNTGISTPTISALPTVGSYTQLQASVEIPNNQSNGLEISIYVYFDGEDVECKSENISAAVMDTLKADIKFRVDNVA